MFTCDKTQSLREIIASLDTTGEMHLLERVELAMLLAARTGDVAVNTMGACLDAEQDIEFPVSEDNEDLIDTEIIYEIVEVVGQKILEERYGKNETLDR